MCRLAAERGRINEAAGAADAPMATKQGIYVRKTKNVSGRSNGCTPSLATALHASADAKAGAGRDVKFRSFQEVMGH